MAYEFTQKFGIANGCHNIGWLIQQSQSIPKTFVEVGVFEGGTTTWVGDEIGKHNRDMDIICIDPHEGSVDLQGINFNEVQDRFKKNVEQCSHKRIEYINKYSNKGLIELINRGTRAQMIYIDGDHRASTVLTDLTLAWQILDIAGVMICDDTNGWMFQESDGTMSAQMSPRMAVEAFIMCNWHKIRMIPLPKSEQTAFVKVME